MDGACYPVLFNAFKKRLGFARVGLYAHVQKQN